GGVQLAALPFADPGHFIVEEAAKDPFAALGVSIVPENVTQVTKTEIEPDAGSFINEKVVSVEPKMTFAGLLHDSDIDSEDTADIAAALGNLVDLKSLEPGNKVRIGFAAGNSGTGMMRPVRVSIYQGGVHQ